MNKIKMHPVLIFYGIRQFIFLLIIPLLRGLVYYLVNSSIYLWIKGSWIDITTLMVIIWLSVIKWYNYNIYYDGDKIIISFGDFINEKILIKRKDISHIFVQMPFYLQFMNALKIKINTFNEVDIPGAKNIILSSNQLNKLNLINENKINNKFVNSNNLSLHATLYTAVLSLVMSNSFAGVLLASTFISASGKLLGDQFKKEIYGSFTKITKKLAFGFPPAGVAITYVLIGGWCIAFIRNLILYTNFSVKKKHNRLIIRSGIININKNYIHLNDVNYIDIVQNLFTKLSKVCSVFVSTKDARNGEVVAITAISKTLLDSNINKLFNKNIKNLNRMNCIPKKTSFISYVYLPIFLFCATSIVLKLLINTYNNWKDFLVFIDLMVAIFFGWLTIIKIINFLTCGFTHQSNNFIIKCSKIFKFHTIIIPVNQVAKIEVNQSIIQKYFNTCNVIIHTNSKSKYCIQSIDFEKVKQFLLNVNL